LFLADTRAAIISINFAMLLSIFAILDEGPCASAERLVEVVRSNHLLGRGLYLGAGFSRDLEQTP
jgi:hypothetical protein